MLTYLKNILNNTNILILNVEESSYLVKKNSIKDKLIGLKKMGPEIVIITNGANPIYCIDANNEFYSVYPLDIKVVEVTGAGDSFSSSFLAGIIKTGDFDFSLKLAIVNSHSVLRYKGAKNNLLAYSQAEKEISQTQIKIMKGIFL
jgi:sugar/nucleoside kinase (ribokinase family)